jgi:peptidase E
MLSTADRVRGNATWPLRILLVTTRPEEFQHLLLSMFHAGLLIGRTGRGVEPNVIHPHKSAPSDADREMISEADLIYFPDGGAEFAAQFWDGLCADIEKALQRGAVVFGHNLGATIWGTQLLYETGLGNGQREYEHGRGLNLFPWAMTFQANNNARRATRNNDYPQGATRRDIFVAMLEKQHINGVALDEDVAILVRDDTVTVISGRVTVHVWEDDHLVKHEYRSDESFNVVTLEREP